MTLLPRSALVLAALSLLTSGCATLLRGSTDTVTVTADRDSAFVFVNGVAAGVTPARISLRRVRDHRIEVVRDSFRIARTHVDRTLNPAVAVGSALFGGGTGLAVDVSTGALYDIDTEVVHVALVPDTARADAAVVASLIQRAREIEAVGFVDANPLRRRAPPWTIVQLAVGTYFGDGTGGIGSSAQIGVQGRWATARLSATGSAGVILNNSTRWEVAALVGVAAETANGRVRVGVAAGPGLAGGRESNACFLLCSGTPRERRALPTRLGVSGLGEAHLLVTPHVGFGVQVPVNLHADDVLSGVMVGLRFEGL